MRLLTRLTGRNEMRGGWDDAVVVLAWLCCLPLPVLASSLAADGIGRDVWYVDLTNLTRLFRNVYIASLFYNLASGFSKITILAFYLRIFPSRVFRRITWAMVILSAVWGILFTCLWAFQCRPISSFWNRFSGPVSGQCLRIDLLGMAQSILNITIEVAIFLLPIPILLKLRLDWRKKTQVRLNQPALSVSTCLVPGSLLAKQAPSRDLAKGSKSKKS